jgi:hypothetical protein
MEVPPLPLNLKVPLLSPLDEAIINSGKSLPAFAYFFGIFAPFVIFCSDDGRKRDSPSTTPGRRSITNLSSKSHQIILRFAPIRIRVAADSVGAGGGPLTECSKSKILIEEQKPKLFSTRPGRRGKRSNHRQGHKDLGVHPRSADGGDWRGLQHLRPRFH